MHNANFPESTNCVYQLSLRLHRNDSHDLYLHTQCCLPCAQLLQITISHSKSQLQKCKYCTQPYPVQTIAKGIIVVGVLAVCEFVFSPSLQAKHATPGNSTWGVDGERGVIADMKDLGVWDLLSVKVQTYKSAIEVCESTPAFCYTQTHTF